MKKENNSNKSDLDLAKEYILINDKVRHFESVLSRHHIGLDYKGLLQKKKELKSMTNSLSKIATTLLNRNIVSCKKDHFKVLQKCEDIIKDNS